MPVNLSYVLVVGIQYLHVFHNSYSRSELLNKEEITLGNMGRSTDNQLVHIRK